MSLVEIFNGAVILILMRRYFVVEWKVWKNDDVKSFRWSSVSIKFSVEGHISYGASVGWGNESLFAGSESHDQAGLHAHIW